MKHDTTLGLLCHLGIIFATFRVSLGQSCTFQSGLCDWISVGSGPRWRSSRDPNTSSSSSPEELKSYAYVTISQNTDNDTAAILQSQEVNAATTDTIEIGFQYQLSDHNQGDLPNTLSVRWSKNEEDFNDVWHTNGPTNSWVTSSLVLAQGGVSRFAFLAKSTVPSQDTFVMIRNVEITIIHDSCASSPCNNGGLCFGNGPTFTCICTGGYRGEVCQILPGDTLSRFLRGRSSYRGITIGTAAHHGNIDHITSTPTIKGTPQFIDTSTDLPTSYDSTSLISEQTTKFKGQETRGMSTMSRRLATNPTAGESTTDPSPCFRRSPVPSVTAATTSVSGVTNEMTNAGTSNTMNTGTDVTSGSKLTTQSETQQSTEQTHSTLSRSTIESLTLVTSGIPELTTDSLSMTTATHPMTFPTTLPTTPPNTITTYFDDFSTTATDVVSDISSTDTSIETDFPSSEDYSTLPETSTSFKSTESDQTTQQIDPISSTTEGTTVEVSSRSTTKQFVTQSVTTTEEIATVTGVVSQSTHNIITSVVIGLSTEESTNGPYTPSGADPMTSETNGIVTQSSTTRLGDDGTNTGYMSTMDTTKRIITTMTTEAATSSVSTGESITDLETSVYSISTGMVTSAVTENYDLDTSQALTTRTATLSTESTKFKPSSTDESSETSYVSTVEIVTDRNLTDIPTTGIGVASTLSSSSSSSTTTTSISVSSSSHTSNSSTTDMEVSSDVSRSTIATTLNSNLTRSTGNITSPVTDALSSSQSSLNSTSASVSGGGEAVNVPLAVGLSVTGVVGTVAAGVTILIVRRARRVSYGLTES
ncbi:mucin-5AC-like isoform X2 [Lytechinus pictus]|uniref:mucin-5AC-like isoform X2 n=1 Tax=Lytechinus pictus TaxID=7653 RepID=UPI0030BA27A4